MTFYVENEVETDFGFDIEEVSRVVAEKVLELEGCNYPVEIGLTITDDEGIKVMNSEFRGIDSPTDVLSFPNVSYETAGDFSVIDSDQKVDLLNPDTGGIMFGDIVINEARVRSQASDYGHSLKREFAFLVAHSMLHLMGFDHMNSEDAAIMEDKQRIILDKVSIRRNN